MNLGFILEFSAVNSALTSFCEVFITETCGGAFTSPAKSLEYSVSLCADLLQAYVCMYGWT